MYIPTQSAGVHSGRPAEPERAGDADGAADVQFRQGHGSRQPAPVTPAENRTPSYDWHTTLPAYDTDYRNRETVHPIGNQGKHLLTSYSPELSSYRSSFYRIPRIYVLGLLFIVY